MVQVTMTRVIVDPVATPSLQAEFDHTGIAHLPGFLTPDLLSVVLGKISSATFTPRDEVGKKTGAVFGTTLVVSPEEPVMAALQFLLNRPELFQVASEVCRVPRPGNFLCRMHRTLPSSEQHIDWHGDAVDTRMAGLNINVSRQPFTGGKFQVRDPEKRVTAEVSDWAPGDAFLFRIDGGWEHRLTPVVSGERTVAVGWFRKLPVWHSWNFDVDSRSE
jgi:hypothetical protein